MPSKTALVQILSGRNDVFQIIISIGYAGRVGNLDELRKLDDATVQYYSVVRVTNWIFPV